jgi:hypothetical protein
MAAKKKPRKPDADAEDAPSRRPLTPQQGLFADAVIEGCTKTDAYRRAYPASSLTGHALNVEASRTAALPHVDEYIAEALAERRREALLTRDQKRQILGGIAKNTRTPAHARIMAVRVDNDMTGDNAPVRVEGEITLHAVLTAMAGTTGLPGQDELVALGAPTPKAKLVRGKTAPAKPAGRVVEATVDEELAGDEELIPAMERRRHA